jgi:hypothetical protein
MEGPLLGMVEEESEATIIGGQPDRMGTEHLEMRAPSVEMEDPGEFGTVLFCLTPQAHLPNKQSPQRQSSRSRLLSKSIAVSLALRRNNLLS